MRNPLVRVLVGLVAGAILGGVAYAVIDGLKMDWKYGPRVPLYAGVVVGAGVALLFAVSRPRDRS